MSFKQFFTESEIWKKYPNIEEQKHKDLVTLLSIESFQDIETVTDLKFWKDDGQLCIGCHINGVPISFWWLADFGTPGAAMIMDWFRNPNDPKCKKEVFGLLKFAIEQADDDADFYERLEKARKEASLEKNLDPETKENWKEIVRGL